MIVVAQIFSDKACNHRDGKIGCRTLKIGYRSFPLGIDGGLCLLNHVVSFHSGLVLDVGLNGFAGLLRVSDDLSRLGLRIGELLAILLKQTLAFDARILGLLQGVLDGLVATLHDPIEDGPTEFGEDDDQDDEGNEQALGEQYPLVLDAAFSHADQEHTKNISRELSSASSQLVFALMQKDWLYAKDGLSGKIGRQYELQKVDETEVRIVEVTK